jgi:hypothetical protein
MTPAEIALLCHEANRAYCRVIGDPIQRPWHELETEHRDDLTGAVTFVLEHPLVAAVDLHERWRSVRTAQGWTWGPRVDFLERRHPGLVDYHLLPDAQARKLELFIGIVSALRAASAHEAVPAPVTYDVESARRNLDVRADYTEVSAAGQRTLDTLRARTAQDLITELAQGLTAEQQSLEMLRGADLAHDVSRAASELEEALRQEHERREEEQRRDIH